MRCLPLRRFAVPAAKSLLLGCAIALWALCQPALAEDSEAGVDGNFIMTASGKLVEVQMSAEGTTFNRGQMDKLLDLAQAGVADLVTAQRAAVA